MNNSQGNNLIFIVSQPRSGSTLLQLILSGHPDIATTSEPWIALHPLYAIKESGIDTEYGSKLSRRALKAFLRQAGIDDSFYKKEVASFLTTLYSLAIKNQEKKFFLDKTPRYYYIIPELMEIFPKAKFIILFRHPLAVLNSILKTWVKDDLALLGEYRDDLLLAPVKLTDCLRNYPERCYKAIYEEIIVDPENVINEVCRFLGISYSENMTDYRERLDPEWELGDTIGVRNESRPTGGSVEKWKTGFTSPQERLLAGSYIGKLGPELIKYMGYNPDEAAFLNEDLNHTPEEKLVSWDDVMSAAMDKTGQIRTINRLTEERDSLINSISWKITGPMRRLYEIFHKHGK